MGLHRLFLLGVARGRAPEVIAALDAAIHPCVAETERRIREGDVEQALLVAQSDDIAGLRALQERLTALGCAAFVSESTSWQARAWEALSAPWRGGVREVAARLLTAKARAVLLSVAAFLALLAGLVAVSSLTSRDPHRASLSPLERLTQTGNGAHAPSGRTEGADHEATPSQVSSGGGGAGGARDDNLHDPTATPLEIGAFFAGLFLSLALGTLAARRLRAPGRGATRAAQSLGLMLLGVGLWAGTRPREVIRVAGTAREAAGGLTLAAGDESIDGQDTPDGGGDGDGGTRGGSGASRTLRGPFDRFVRSMAIHTSGAPAPTFASLLESLRASAPATPTVTEGDPSTSAPATSGDVADAGDPQGARHLAGPRARGPSRDTPRDERVTGRTPRAPRTRRATRSPPRVGGCTRRASRHPTRTRSR